MTYYRLPLLLLLGFAQPVLAQTSPPLVNNISTTNAGQATGSVVNSATQVNQLPVLTQQYGPGYACQNSTLYFSPYYLTTSPSYGYGTSGLGGMISLALPLDSRGVESCMALAKARVAKEQFDLTIVRALKCAELLRAGISLASPEPGKPSLCAGISYNPAADTTRGQLLPIERKTRELVITK